MGLIVKLYTFSAGATIIASEHNSNFDVAYNEINGNLDNTNIKANAAIADSKLGQITTAGKVSGTALTLLANISSAAGIVPSANLPTPIPTANGGTGSTANANAASGVVVLDASSKLPAVDGSLLTGLAVAGKQLFTSSGTFTAPAGITKVYITMVGAGAGGAGGRSVGSQGGGGGGGGQAYLSYPYTVTPGNGYTITINAAGTGGGSDAAGNNGGTTVFDNLIALGGIGAPNTTGGAGAGQNNASTTTIGYPGHPGGNGGNISGTSGGAGGGSAFGTGGTTAHGNASGNGAGGGGGDYANQTGGNGSIGFVLVEY